MARPSPAIREQRSIPKTPSSTSFFFGFLSGIIGSSFQINDFIRESRFITLAPLPNHIVTIQGARGKDWLQEKAQFLIEIVSRLDHPCSGLPCLCCELEISVGILYASIIEILDRPVAMYFHRLAAVKMIKERLLSSGVITGRK